MRDHPFFQDFPEISEELRSFYDDIFSAEGDIFENCLLDSYKENDS